MIHIDALGGLVLIEDGGRPGHAHLGVSPSGAADRGSWQQANRRVGNAGDAAAFEVLLGPLSWTWTGDHALWIAVAGAPGGLAVNGAAAATNRAVLVHPGDEVTVGPADVGLRRYLAVRGGLDVPQTLGSASTDVLSGLGAAPVAIGDQYATGPAQALPPNRIEAVVDLTGPTIVELHPGPRLDWFPAEALTQLSAARWTVDAESNRIAVRLLGPPIDRSRNDELPSEALLRGAVQIPPNGQPVIFGSDHPTTGGYPVIAVATPASVDRLAQARPGTPVTLRLT